MNDHAPNARLVVLGRYAYPVLHNARWNGPYPPPVILTPAPVWCECGDEPASDDPKCRGYETLPDLCRLCRDADAVEDGHCEECLTVQEDVRRGRVR